MNYRNKKTAILMIVILLHLGSQAQINPLFERYSKPKKLIEVSQHIPYYEVLQNIVLTWVFIMQGHLMALFLKPTGH
jgi:hypothetical protein